MSTIKTNQLAHTANGASVYTLPQTDGSAGQVLQTNGSGALSWVTLPTDSNTWVKLSTIDASNSGNINFSNSITGAFDTYKQYVVIFNGLQFENDGIDLRHRISDSNGTYSSAEYATRILDSGGNGNHTGLTFVRFNQNSMGNNKSGSTIYEDCSGHIYMTNFAANLRYQFHGVVSFGDTGSNKRFCPFGGGVNVNTETTGINFFTSNGNITTGKFTLYGIKQ